jgi:hypothetical protein
VVAAASVFICICGSSETVALVRDGVLVGWFQVKKRTDKPDIEHYNLTSFKLS